MYRRVLFTCFVAMLLTTIVSAQHLNVELLASNLTTSSRMQLDVGGDNRPELASPHRSEDFDPAAKAGRSYVSKSDVSRAQFENWLVVSVLGLCFAFGLVVTLVSVRRSTSNVPTRLF